MGLYIRNGRYYYKRQIDKIPYYKALNLKKGDERFLSSRLQQVEDWIYSKHYGIPSQTETNILFSTFEEAYEKYKKHKSSLERDLQRLRIIRKVLNDPCLKWINKGHIRKLEDYLFAQKRSQTTVNRYFQTLHHFLSLAIEEGHIKENPIKGYEYFIEAKRRRALSEEELKKIFKESKYISSHPLSLFQKHWNDILLLSFHTAMRLSEVLKLKKSYITDNLIVYPVAETKSRKRSITPIKDTKIIVLNKSAQEIINRQQSQDDFVFPLKNRNENVVIATVRTIRGKTGINDFTFHLIRHTVSTYLASKVSIFTAKTILGHSDIKTTLRYSHPQVEEQKKGVAKIDTYFKQLTD